VREVFPPAERLVCEDAFVCPSAEAALRYYAAGAIDALLQFLPVHPLRVRIDGRSAAGKTTFADEHSVRIERAGRRVLRASIDDFHRQGHRDRSRQRIWTPQSYYDEGFDYEAF
jgi:uridine kinase